MITSNQGFKLNLQPELNKSLQFNLQKVLQARVTFRIQSLNAAEIQTGLKQASKYNTINNVDDQKTNFTSRPLM